MRDEREYSRMAEAEATHWWYRSLQFLVLAAIEEKTARKDVTILDAGCGTGGLISFLSARGYSNLTGFDLSETAVRLATAKAPEVFRLDVREATSVFPEETFDFILCNDVLYYLSPIERKALLCDFHLLLKPGGRVIVNLPALAAFRGRHDLAVDITSRFRRSDLDAVFTKGAYVIIKSIYWPFLLAPIVFLVRAGQRLSLAVSKRSSIESDVKLPFAPLNALLFGLTRLENRFLRFKPFGSSLFVVAEKV